MPEPSDTKPTDPGALVEAAEREAHDLLNRCGAGEFPGPEEIACGQAITRLSRIARLAGRVEGAETLHIKNCSCCDSPNHVNHMPTDPRCNSVRNRLRAELAALEREGSDG